MQVHAGKTPMYGAWILLSLVVLLFPAVAHAEPSPSMSHIPLLWLAVTVAATLLAMVPLLIRKLLKPRRAAWAFWVASALLAVLFLVFIGPVIVGMGSILITGRTM